MLRYEVDDHDVVSQCDQERDRDIETEAPTTLAMRNGDEYDSGNFFLWLRQLVDV